MTSSTGQQMDAVVMQASGPPAQALAVRSDIPPATATWRLENGIEAYQKVKDGAAGIKQVLLPNGGRAPGR